MKYYIVSCRISSKALPGGGVGDCSVSKIYSEKELKPVENNLRYLISQKQVIEFENEEDAKVALGNTSAKTIEEDRKIIEEGNIEEEAKAELPEVEPIPVKKKSKKKSKK